MKTYFSKKAIIGLAASLALSLLTSCTFVSKYSNRDNALKLRKGMPEAEVLAIMGEPLRNAKFSQPDIWFYYIETRWAFDCKVTRDECLPIVFKDGKIQGWGVEYYKEHIEFPDNTKK